MSLRDALRQIVARCTPIEMQHATFSHDDATSTATRVQQQAENPHSMGILPATGAATAVQQRPKTYATFASEIGVESCTELHASLTAHRITLDLIRAAMQVCDRHGDDETARKQMRSECMELPLRLQADLLAHFNPKAERLE